MAQNKTADISKYKNNINLTKNKTIESSNGLPLQFGNLAVGGFVYSVMDIILIKNSSYPGYHLHWQGFAPCVGADDGPIVGTWDEIPTEGQKKINVFTTVVADEVELVMADLSGGHMGDFHSLGLGAGLCGMTEQFNVQQVNTIVLSGNKSKKSYKSKNSKKSYKATSDPDFFIYDRKTKFNKINAPVIEGFNSEEGDRIRFIGKAEDKVPFFDDLGLVTVNTRKQLKRASQSNFDFVYHQSQGYLYHNHNLEEKGFGKGGLMAVLLESPTLDESSFGATT